MYRKIFYFDKIDKKDDFEIMMGFIKIEDETKDSEYILVESPEGNEGSKLVYRDLIGLTEESATTRFNKYIISQ